MSLFCFLFWHRWRPQAVQATRIFAFRPSGEEYTTGHKTNVLLRCERCPKVKTRLIDGQWTLEQLLLGEEMRNPRAPERVK